MRAALRLARRFGVSTVWAIRSGKPVVPFHDRGHTYVMPNDGSLIYHLNNSVEKMRRLASYVEPADKVIVDIGAHAGLFSAFAKERAPDARIVAVEADPYLRPLIERNFPHGERIFKAVTDSPGRVSFFRSSSSTQTSSLLKEVVEGKTDSLMVEATTIDELCVDLQCVDVLKIDVQGAELLVLEGGKNTLPNVRTLLIEVSFMDPKPERVLSLLRDEFGAPEVVNPVAYGADLAYSHHKPK